MSLVPKDSIASSAEKFLATLHDGGDVYSLALFERLLERGESPETLLRYDNFHAFNNGEFSAVAVLLKGLGEEDLATRFTKLCWAVTDTMDSLKHIAEGWYNLASLTDRPKWLKTLLENDSCFSALSLICARAGEVLSKNLDAILNGLAEEASPIPIQSLGGMTVGEKVAELVERLPDAASAYGDMSIIYQRGVMKQARSALQAIENSRFN